MLENARRLAEGQGVHVRLWQVDLEASGESPLSREAYGAVLVFRYLHRPLMPSIRDALRPGGILMYETFTVDQRRFGKPRSPDHLLQPGELGKWFGDWERIHQFEGTLADPERAVAQLVCRKPA
jgi:SAM-dependent methyltransferase